MENIILRGNQNLAASIDKLAAVLNIVLTSKYQLILQAALTVPLAITASAGIAGNQAVQNQKTSLNQSPRSEKITAHAIELSAPESSVLPVVQGMSREEVQQKVQEARLLESAGKLEAAIDLWKIICNNSEIMFGHDHRNTALCLGNLANLYRQQAVYGKSESLFLRILSELESSSAPEDRYLTANLNNLALLYAEMAEYAKAEALYLKSNRLTSKTLGHLHPDTATGMNNLAGLYSDQGLYNKAETLYKQAIKITLNALGPNHPNSARNFNNLGILYVKKGLLKKGEALISQALKAREEILGPNHPETLTSKRNLAGLYTEQGLYSKAEALHKEALKATIQAQGQNHPSTAASLSNLANLYQKQGLTEKAEPLYIQALAIREISQGPIHPDTVISISNLATLYEDQGYYSKADTLYKKAREITNKTIGENNPITAIILNNLASLYQKQGQTDKAMSLSFQSLAIREKVLGADHPGTASSLNNLASLYYKQGIYNKAETLYIRALAITEKALGAHHPDTVRSLNNLALFYYNQRLYAKAEQLYKRALRIREKAPDLAHTVTGTILNNLALLYKEQGLFIKAEMFHKKAIAIEEKTHGTNGLIIANTINNLAILYGEMGLLDKQMSILSNGISAENHWLIREAPMQSQKNRSILIKQIGNGWILAFDLAQNHPKAAELALKTRLNRQGIQEEIEQRQSSLLRTPGPQQELASQLGALNTQLASISLNSNQRQELRTQRDQLETDLYRLMPDLQLKELSPTEVAAVLPTDSVLVEFQRYQPYNYKLGNSKNQHWGQARYLALILKPNGFIKAFPLGPAKPIEAAIAKALASTQEALADSQSNWDPVRHLILDPLQSQLKGSNHWFLSPDAELTRIPFLALPAANSGQRLLSDDVTLSVLTTGRDLLRLQKLPGSAEKAAVIVNPSYALGGANSSIGKSDLSDQTGQRRSAELGSKTWTPLPQTQQEGEEIAKLLSVPLISKDKATTNLLQSIHAPKVLHIATHGFFQPNQEITPPDLLRTISSDHQLLSGLKTEDPMLRSGLVLAGADNPTANPADDGYLTAAEAAGLQLDGTELVVLSACSTGQGDSKTGEGVYGLQRALTMAGARSTLLSLWKVDDDATRAFMVRYYTLLKEGKGRGEALVQVQREFRTDPAYKAKGWDRPYYWAAWQLTGDWKPIQGL